MLSTELSELMSELGVVPGYHGLGGQWVTPDAEALVRVLACLGAQISRPEDAADALAVRRREREAGFVDAVVTCQLGERPRLLASLPGRQGRPYRLRVASEGDADREAHHSVLEGRLGDEGYVELGAQHRMGSYELQLEIEDDTFEACLLVEPARAYAPEDPAQWGVFAPTYALRGRGRDSPLAGKGSGDLRELGKLVDWVGARGGHAVATLPLLAQFLDALFEPSPYSPASRLFWNEFYLDLDALPEVRDAAARSGSLGAARLVGELEAAPLVDYRRLSRLRRRVLEPASQAFFQSGADSSSAFREFCARTGAQRYAAFQATVESRRTPFHDWPRASRLGQLGPDDYLAADRRYHLYCQFRLDQQMAALSERARGLGLGLYLDLPLGVHGAGYDLWAEPDAFLAGCSAGAPPDMVFTSGQNWGTAPLSPEGCRRQGYRYLRQVIRHQLRGAGALRVDHVMGLQRIFCIPDGMEGSRGVYVGYPARELFALLSIESHRHGALLVGEDLGTVPSEIPEALESRGIRRMHVLEYALAGHSLSFDTLTENAVASVNTHDLAPFAGWCACGDIELRLQAGQIDEAEAAAQRAGRAAVLDQLEGHLRHEGRFADDCEGGPPRVQRLLAGALELYGSSVAPLVILSLEDAWLEREPQNVPGTTSEFGNWRRRLTTALEDLDEVAGLPTLIDRVRKARDAARERMLRTRAHSSSPPAAESGEALSDGEPLEPTSSPRGAGETDLDVAG